MLESFGLGRFGHFPRLGIGQGNRLFAEDMQTSVQALS